MSIATDRFTLARIRCHWRPVIMVGAGLVLLSIFWFASRYPQLFSIAQHGLQQPANDRRGRRSRRAAHSGRYRQLARQHEDRHDLRRAFRRVAAHRSPLLSAQDRQEPVPQFPQRGARWRADGRMRELRRPGCVWRHPRKWSHRGRLGVLIQFAEFQSSRGHDDLHGTPACDGSDEVRRPVICWLEREKPLPVFTVGDEGAACAIQLPSPDDCQEKFTTVFGELTRDFGKHVWMLLKPTITLMLLASVVSATLLVLIPWDSLLSEVTPLKAALLSLISVFMPVPIALDVMFAAQLQQQGVPAGYIMMFAMTLGTYSIIPSIYLWREVSRPLAVSLFVFFWALGLALALLF